MAYEMDAATVSAELENFDTSRNFALQGDNLLTQSPELNNTGPGFDPGAPAPS